MTLNACRYSVSFLRLNREGRFFGVIKSRPFSSEQSLLSHASLISLVESLSDAYTGATCQS